MTDGDLRDFLRLLAHAVDQDDMEEEAERLRFESAGYRLVTGVRSDRALPGSMTSEPARRLRRWPTPTTKDSTGPLNWVHVDSRPSRERCDLKADIGVSAPKGWDAKGSPLAWPMHSSCG